MSRAAAATWLILADTRQTMEVATARVYNWDVVQRRKDKADGKEEDGKETQNG